VSADIGDPAPRVDAEAKAAGSAGYLADLRIPGALQAITIRSAKSRARILSVRYPDLPDGYFIVDKRDIPHGGRNAILMIKDDWPVFADAEVRFKGQAIALAVGPERGVLESIAARTVVEYQEKTPAFTIDESLGLVGGPIHGTDNLFADYRLRKGDPEGAFARASQIVEEEFSTGFQEHVYLETQGCIAAWEDGRIVVHASIQCPFYLKKSLMHALGCAGDRVRVIQVAVGGGFGGKEHYPDAFAATAAVAAWKLHKPVRIVFDRREDMRFTSKRHPSRIRFRTALDIKGGILGMEVDTVLNAGAYETCSAVVLQRSIFHATGVYDIPNVAVRGRACATNTVPSDAFRGFGAPQALFAIEMHMSHLARGAGMDPVEYKRGRFLKKGDTTVSNGHIYENVMLPRMTEIILTRCGYDGKKKRRGRGIGISFFLHGCGFTGSGERDKIKGAVVLDKQADGKVMIRTATVDMGQGPQTTFRKIVAAVLGIPISDVLFDLPDTDAVPDSGPTVASRSIMVVGYLLQEAAKKLKACWKDGQEQSFRQCYLHPPHLRWDAESLRGDAYPVYGWGINAVEVRLDPVTYEAKVENVWTVYDVGRAVDRLIVEGQAHGGMAQALGWGALEKLELRDGAFAQDSLADYAIPTSLDFPGVSVELVDNPYPLGPFGAKGTGELVFDGGAPAFALAVEAALGAEARELPLTPERIMAMMERAE
jgi:CO/xanthine dehydrogenase Mo-binding subunit